jgi:predicted HTH transcriptional regulator
MMIDKNTKLSDLTRYKENNRLEAKKAKGGLPQSIWETYSSFANTEGGLILLGVNELAGGMLEPFKLDDPEKLIKDFWDVINNPLKISANILVDANVVTLEEAGAHIIVIEVPRGDRHQKPIYVGPDPFKGSFRRNGEGDYRCKQDEVMGMIRDKADVSQDTLVLEQLDMKAFDPESIAGYRRRLELSRPGHVWLRLSDDEFLMKLGAAEYGEKRVLHPTAAGVLMFGFEDRIMREFPNYFLDYREVEPGADRWVHRFVSSSGDWSGNVFDFFYRAYNRMQQIIETPFRIAKNGRDRIDDTPVHKAMREALANALINADYYGRQGLVIIRGLKDVRIANPGRFRIGIDEAISGGLSDPRNATLMKMFNLLDIGERAGSGLPNIFAVWSDEGWVTPKVYETLDPDRTVMELFLASEDDLVAALTASDVNRDDNDGNDGNCDGNDGNDGNDLDETTKKILRLIKEHPEATYLEIAKSLSISEATVTRNIRKMKKSGLIKRIGSTRGEWEIAYKI